MARPRELRGFPPVVDVRRAGTPGPEHGRRGCDVDVGLVRPLPVLEGRARVGIGGHGAVDGEPGGLAHLLQEGVLHRLLPGRQHQLQIGAVADIGAHGPGRAVDGLDGRQAHRQGEAEEVEVGIVVAAAAVPEDAEGEAPPLLGMDRAVEEGAARQLLAVRRNGRGVGEHYAQRIIAGGIRCRVADRGGGLGRPERNRRPVRERRAVAGANLGFPLPQKMRGREIDGPAGRGLPVRGTGPRGDGAAAARQAGETEAGGVLATDQVRVPSVLAEAQQHGGISNARAIVGDGDGEGRPARSGGAVCRVLVQGGDRNTHARGAGAAAVLERFEEDVGESGCVNPGDAPDGAVVDAGADGLVHGWTSMALRKRKRPAGLPRSVSRGRRAGGAIQDWRTVTGPGAGTPGYPWGPARRHGR